MGVAPTRHSKRHKILESVFFLIFFTLIVNLTMRVGIGQLTFDKSCFVNQCGQFNVGWAISGPPQWDSYVYGPFSGLAFHFDYTTTPI